MDNRIIREEYAEMAAKIIEEEPLLTDIANSHATIIYLGSDNPKTAKGKTVCGECEKVQDKNKWAIPADFTIYFTNCSTSGLNSRTTARRSTASGPTITKISRSS